MSETPLHPQPDPPPASSVAEENKPSPPSPLEIALQEYAYWRDSESAVPQFLDIQMGALGAAANIAGRLALPGVELEGIKYRTLTPEQIRRAMAEIAWAPRLAQAIEQIEKRLRETSMFRSSMKSGHDDARKIASGLLAELQEEGVL